MNSEIYVSLPKVPEKIVWDENKKLAIQLAKEAQPELIVTTGCFNFIDQESSTATQLIAGLHEGHLELFELLAILRQQCKAKVVLYLDSSYAVQTLKHIPLSQVLPYEDRKWAVETNPFCHIDFIIEKFHGSSMEVSEACHLKPFILVKDTGYLKQSLPMATGNCRLVILQQKREFSSSQMNKEWLENLGEVDE